ncbi:MAG: ATP-dependent zinc metalloprotease FtsH [Actinomycetota bacterium]|nr:ATP-dependent zinc metalloprotease FtsH [Actinomycetota bacterium]
MSDESQPEEGAPRPDSRLKAGGRLPGRPRGGGDQPGPSRTPQAPGGPRSVPGRSPWRATGILVVLLIVGWFLVGVFGNSAPAPRQLSYTTFLSQASAGKVRSVTISSSGGLTGTLKDGQTFTSQVPTALGQSDLVAQMQKDHVGLTATGSGTDWAALLWTFVSLGLLGGLFFFMTRRASAQVGAFGGVGKVRAKVSDTERPTTTFADVAGYEGVKREVAEIIEFLRTPERYRRAGAVGPRGILMLGPPGTGKTLLARAIAGEASVPFLSVTGSAFVEMFVGVGAARVRDLFVNARKVAPAIIFIDEVDAIGQRRGGSMVSNDEREQTLNQLLSEMDGFDPAEGIVVLAATNRPEVLDPALLRPGRFDRQVVVPLPTRSERHAILTVHSRDKHLAPGVDLDVVARATPGFSGADLANLANEAAICAVRAGRAIIEADDFGEARDRILLGHRDASRVLLADERHSVAVHESGHAIVAALLPDADPVAKVSILPAGQALGVTEQLPLDERHLFSERHLLAALAVRLGGRAAEIVVNGEGSTGAADDLASATQLATRMVREFGLSPEMGPVGYTTGSPMYLGKEEVTMRTYSEATQRVVDEAVQRILREAEDRATRLLQTHRAALDKLAELLVEKETIDGSAVDEVLAAAGHRLVRRGAA